MAKAFRVVLDEPVGICVGFRPEVGMEMDELEVFSDDGGSNVFMLGGERVALSKLDRLNSERGGIFPEPDLVVWRTPDDFNEWHDENVE